MAFQVIRKMRYSYSLSGARAIRFACNLREAQPWPHVSHVLIYVQKGLELRRKEQGQWSKRRTSESSQGILYLHRGLKRGKISLVRTDRPKASVSLTCIWHEAVAKPWFQVRASGDGDSCALSCSASRVETVGSRPWYFSLAYTQLLRHALYVSQAPCAEGGCQEGCNPGGKHPTLAALSLSTFCCCPPL